MSATRQLIAAAVLDGEFCGGRREPPGVLVRSSRPPPISMTADGCVGHGYTRRDEVHGRILHSLGGITHKCSRLLLLLLSAASALSKIDFPKDFDHPSCAWKRMIITMMER